MSIIDRNTNLSFKSADYVIADVKRFLKSYDSANVIDEGEFPMYIRDVLRELGRGVMKVSEAIIKPNTKIVNLPDDFQELYAAYRCRDTSYHKYGKAHEQNSTVLYNDITKDIIYTDKNCCINCFANNHQIIERVTIKQMVSDSDCMLNFSYPIPLNLSNKSVSPFASQNFGCNSENDIILDGKQLHINFEDDWLYVIYYAFPLDEFGVPMLPDINAVYQAIKWYSIYQISLSWYWNNDVPDIQNKWQMAESQYRHWLGESSYYVKLPSFGEIIDANKLNSQTSLYNFFTTNMYRNS